MIAGVFAPIFLQGTVCQNDSKEVEKAGLNPSRTITLSKLSKEAESEHTLLTALKSVSVRHCKIHWVKAKTLIEVSSVEEEDKRSTLSLVEDTSFSCKFLFQIYLSSKHTIVLPNPNYRPGSSETIDALSIDRQIKWHLFDTSQNGRPKSTTVVPYQR